MAREVADVDTDIEEGEGETEPKPNYGEQCIVRPGEGEEWEVWGITSSKGDYELTGTVEHLEALKGLNILLFAFPLKQVFNLPIVANTTDPALMNSIILNKCEKFALLAPAGEETVYDFDVIIQSENQSTLVVWILAANMPEAISTFEAQRYDLSARLLPLPKDSFSLWLEHSQLIIAVKWEQKLIYFQALSDKQITQEVLQTLKCIQLQLSKYFEALAVPSFYLFGTFSAEEIDLLKNTFNLDLYVKERPTPEPPLQQCKLTPYTINEKRNQLKKRAKIKKGIVLGVLAYVLFIAGWSGMLLKLKWDSHRTEKRIASDSKEVTTLQEIAAKWENAQPTVNFEYYPLEVLHLITEQMADKGISLTLFEITSGDVNIRGESMNLELVFQFKDALSNAKSLNFLAWSLDSPKIKPDGTTLFVMKGKRTNAI